MFTRTPLPRCGLAEYGVYTPSPALDGDLAVDVVIVGAGFQGMATAIALRSATPALRVAVLEQESVGYGASGRNVSNPAIDPESFTDEPTSQ